MKNKIINHCRNHPDRQQMVGDLCYECFQLELKRRKDVVDRILKNSYCKDADGTKERHAQKRAKNVSQTD